MHTRRRTVHIGFLLLALAVLFASDAPAQPAAIGEEYYATGTNPDGGTYTARINVVKRGEVYQFAWDSAGTKYGGVGVLQGNGLAVAYSEGTDGTGCGVVLYQIKADGVLDGKAGYFGVNTDEDERAVPTDDGRGLSKGYRVTGKTPKGESYSGTLRIEPSGPGFDLVWNTGKELRGFGIARGSQIAASFGGNQCAFVYYKVLRDGTLDGEWGGPGSRTLGTEIARKRR